jgi:mannose-6-phosphate isomerase
MPDLYPLLLRPDFRERPWGTRDLAPIYPDHVCEKPIGEVWLTGDDNRVANGPLAGKTLAELCRENGRSLVGDAAREKHRFPLLVKFLFSREKLSVQVHPDDEAARRAGLPCGKTECWYVLAAEPGAQVALGLKPGVTRATLEQAIREVRAEELLNWVKVHAGEMIYVDAGTVHTIGPGLVLLETQQNSDTTYRLYDYGRPRQIHVEQGLAATKESTRAGKVRKQGCATTLIASSRFVVERFHLEGMRCFEAPHSPQILVAIEGAGCAQARFGTPARFARGEVVVIPAWERQARIAPEGAMELLRMTLPAGDICDPETTL